LSPWRWSQKKEKERKRRKKERKKEKRVPKMENSWFLLHYNAPAHQSVSVTDFFENNVTTLEHLP